MALSRRLPMVMASAALVLTVAAPVRAQGKGNGKGNAHKSSPPSSSPLPNPGMGAAIGPVSVASPIAWLDDASLLAPGSTSLTIGISRWSGTDLSEVTFPTLDAAVGVTPRVQIGASVPHVVGGPDGTGPVGGVGTSYLSAKFALPTAGSSVKLAVSPVLEILGQGAVQAPADSRMQVGFPVSAEVVHGPARVFASTGFFSRGVWFAGGGLSVQTTSKVGATLSFTRSWASDGISGLSRDRRELSGGASYVVKPQMAVYGALGRTLGTTDENGAGTTLSGGLSILFRTHVTK